MTYTGLESIMEHLNQLIYCDNNPSNNHPSILSQRPQLQLLYEELGSMIQTLFNDQKHDLLELKKVRDLKKRFKEAAEEAEDTIDLFVSTVRFRNIGFFRTSLNLEDVMRSIKSIKVEFMSLNVDGIKTDSSQRNRGFLRRFKVIKNPLNLKDVMKLIKYRKGEFRTTNIDDMKMDSSQTTNTLQAQAAGTSCTRNSPQWKNELEETIVGFDRHAEQIRDKLVEDRRELDVISIVGMGGVGKTTLATKVYNDRFVVYHFHVRAWVTVSQTYEKRDILIQILESMGVELDLEEAGDSRLRETLHKRLMRKRYLIVIDDIWSKEAWDNIKLFFPHDNTGSRILVTSRLNEVALHAKPLHGFICFLNCLTEGESWELLCNKVFNGDECPKLLIEPGMQIAKRCHGLPLALVLVSGILAKESTSKDSWEKFACNVSSYFASDESGYLEALALSYHHLPGHLRECFLYLGGFPEDYEFRVRRLLWLWVAEGFIQEAGSQSLEDIAEAYLMDLVERNLLIVAKRKSDGGVKTCRVHDLVRELCVGKAKEERFFLKIDKKSSPSFSHPQGVIKPYKQRRVFTNEDINILDFTNPRYRSIRSLLCFHNSTSVNYDMLKYFRPFLLLRVLDLLHFSLTDIPHVMELVHLRYLAIWLLSGRRIPSSICMLWSLQTLIVKVSKDRLNLPLSITLLVNLRHLWSNWGIIFNSFIPQMHVQTISNVSWINSIGFVNFQRCFPIARKLAVTLYSLHGNDQNGIELPAYLETLELVWHTVNVSELPKYPGSIDIRFPSTLKKLKIVGCFLPWSYMSIIQLLPNLEVLKLVNNAFAGTQWNTSEQQFRQLKFLRFEGLDIKQWEACSTSFPCLKRLHVKSCKNLTKIPLEIGDISTLELIEIDEWSKYNNWWASVIESVERIQKDQHDVGNDELKIIVDGMELSFYLSKHRPSMPEFE